MLIVGMTRAINDEMIRGMLDPFLCERRCCRLVALRRNQSQGTRACVRACAASCTCPSERVCVGRSHNEIIVRKFKLKGRPGTHYTVQARFHLGNSQHHTQMSLIEQMNQISIACIVLCLSLIITVSNLYDDSVRSLCTVYFKSIIFSDIIA